ncbi:MAG: hypothetical protein FK734_20315, partial [Asgard group archaeon]|nr:hypothetical protein [Asgard group archaeon]
MIKASYKLIKSTFILILLGILPILGCMNTQSKLLENENKLTIKSAVSMDFSTYFGGSNGDTGYDVAVTNDGSIYVMGETYSNNFPTKNAYDSTLNGAYSADVFVSKFASNETLLWSTYLGGSMFDHGRGIALADNGDCYVTGYTSSKNFPTQNASYDTFNGESYYDAFVTKFAANGTLLWSSYLGGTNDDHGYGIAVDSDGSCFITGETKSNDFPMINAYNGTYGGDFDVFVAKFSDNGTILWSTFLGGKMADIGKDIAVSLDGSCFVTGSTGSNTFPTLNANYDTFGGNLDA